MAVSIPEECASVNQINTMKNRCLTPLRFSRRSDHKSSRRSVDKGGFFDLRVLLALMLCFVGVALAMFSIKESTPPPVSQPARYMPVPGGELQSEAARLGELELYWQDRLTYPTGRFDPAWVRAAAAQDARIARGIPAGSYQKRKAGRPSPLGTNSFTALGPQPERMTGCSGCFNYTTTEGRVNAILVDPTTTTDGSIVAYAATVGGGVWKTTNCCTPGTTWEVTTDDPLISATAIDALAIDPNNHNT